MIGTSTVIYRYGHDDQNHQNKSFGSSHRSETQGQTTQHERVLNPSSHNGDSCNDQGYQH